MAQGQGQEQTILCGKITQNLATLSLEKAPFKAFPADACAGAGSYPTFRMGEMKRRLNRSVSPSPAPLLAPTTINPFLTPSLAPEIEAEGDLPEVSSGRNWNPDFFAPSTRLSHHSSPLLALGNLKEP